MVCRPNPTPPWAIGLSVIALLMLLSCAIATESAPSPAPAPEVVTPAPAPAPKLHVPPAPTGAPDELPELHGQTDAQILKHMGPPASKEALTMGDCCNEYDVELLNTYPPGQGHDAVEIERWTWIYDGYVVALWFHQVDGTWTVLDTVRYGEGTQF